MHSLATQPAPCKAFRALLDNVEGVAMCNAQRHVYFVDDATGTWRELSNAHVHALQLLGKTDLIQAAAIADGDLLQAVARRNRHYIKMPVAWECRGGTERRAS
jgi:hypothetical protein